MQYIPDWIIVNSLNPTRLLVSKLRGRENYVERAAGWNWGKHLTPLFKQSFCTFTALHWKYREWKCPGHLKFPFTQSFASFCISCLVLFSNRTKAIPFLCFVKCHVIGEPEGRLERGKVHFKLGLMICVEFSELWSVICLFTEYL